MTAWHASGFVALLVLGYLLGSIPFGLVVGKLFYHVDVRTQGSGNVGMTNAWRVLGRNAGIAVLVLDMVKGFVPALLGALLFAPWYTVVIAAAPVVGHVFSIFLKGRGGKGIATGAAVVLAVVPVVFVIVIPVWIVVVLATRYVSAASLAAAFMVPVATIALGEPLPYEIGAVLVAVVLWWAHRGNIARLLAHEERRVTLPWTHHHPPTVSGPGQGA